MYQKNKIFGVILKSFILCGLSAFLISCAIDNKTDSKSTTTTTTINPNIATTPCTL